MIIGSRVYQTSDPDPGLFSRGKAGTVKTFRGRRAYVVFDDGSHYWVDIDYLFEGEMPNYLKGEERNS